MRRFASMALAALMAASLTTTAFAAEGAVFTDVTPTDWYYDAACYAYDKGVEAGLIPAGTVIAAQPDEAITFEELVGAIVLLDGEYITFADAIARGAGVGLTESTAEDALMLVTREHMIDAVYTYAVSQGCGFTGQWMFLLDYADIADISEDCYESIAWCTMQGILIGDEAGMVDPQAYATRAELATVLMRLEALDILDDPAVLVEETV